MLWQMVGYELTFKELHDLLLRAAKRKASEPHTAVVRVLVALDGLVHLGLPHSEY